MPQRYSVKDRMFWRIAVSLLFASLFVFANMYAVQPLLPVFTEAFGVSVSVSSFAMSLTIVGVIVGLILLGFLSDRNGRRGFITFSLIGAALPFFLLPLTDSFAVFLTLRFLQGIALAGVPAAALAYISEEIEAKSVGFATALYISSNALGGMLGRVLTGYLTDRYSWELSFVAFGSVGLLLFMAVLILLPKSRNFEPSNAGFRQDLEGFMFHLKNPSLLLVFGLGAVLQISFTGVWTYLPFYLQGPPFVMSLEAISYLFFAYGLGVVGSPVAGRLAGKWGIGPVRLAGVFTLSAGILLTLSGSITLITIGLCLTCLGFFTAHSLTAASVSQQATHHKGSASSLYLVSYYIGVTLGSSVLSPVWTAGGWTALILLIAALPTAYVLIITLTAKRTGTV
ncbi:MFS transporter [Planococcus lenghuensis]|uniref:MFS transporter n=1 Tax=Planococcus lenghuensis TaxID=2213202 RepID=A0A1Q2L2Y0_9BACL|nr:MFS transporter [Planococcus lenghuensis]AQQ54427.1 MFS transporter [Planococcus lenghuensis]